MIAWLSVGKNWLLGPHASLICRLVLGGLFIYSGWSKIGQQAELTQTVVNFNVLPVFLARPFALVLPWMEILSGGLLILGVLVPSAAALLGLLNLAFLVALGINLGRGTSVDCGCFGHAEPISWEMFARDVGFLLMSLQILVANTGAFTVSGAIKYLREHRSSTADHSELANE